MSVSDTERKPEIVQLRNESEEARAVVMAVMHVLKSLLDPKKGGIRGALAVYELTMACRDPNYQIEKSFRERLTNLQLIQKDGSIHPSVRNVVCSAVEGEGLEMRLVNPLSAEDKAN